MVIIEDRGQKKNSKVDKHRLKHQYFESHGIYWERYPLPCGDYILGTDAVMDVISRKQKRGMDPKKMDFTGTYKVTVDTKRDMQEIIGDICGKDHPRFRDECIFAQNNGIKLYFLIENEDGVRTIDDLSSWNNPRAKIQKWITTPSGERRKVLKYPKATKGGSLAKSMKTMQEEYGVEFLFCHPEEAGAKVLELLNAEV